MGIGAQFGGKYWVHDVRVIRMPRHAASCPVGIGVSCSADRNIKAKITEDGIFLEQLEKNPARFLPAENPALAPAVNIDLDQPMEEVLKELRKYPVKTRLNLSGTLIVARDIAHARIKAMLDEGKPMPEYFKNHPIYYAGPAKTPKGMASGSFGPTTAGRMDPYVDLFQDHGGSMIMVAKGNRSQAVTDACKKHGGFYLGSIGGPAAILAKESIKSVEIVAFEELGMEAIRKIYVGNVVIHPTNKIPVGTRFATAINNLVYNKNAEYTAPVFESLAKGDDNRLIVKFSHVGEGLKCIDCHDNIHGFTICDERNVYVNAQARIISANEVEVWNDGITSPTDVTYAYATYNFTSNLANSVGIPAAPFRSNRNSEALYYSPQDWTMADADTFWGINGDQAAWLQTWTSTDATLTFDQNNKQEGYSSVNVSYTNDNAKFGPITEYASVVNQLENFNYLNVWVYNPDAREKDIRLEVISENDKVFDCGNVKISAKQEWKQISFDLYANVDQNTRFNKELANAKKLYFVISDANRTGNIKVDNITFGLDKLADKDLSAIVNISTGTNVAADNWLYDLWGHKHEYPTAPGIYVRNGKKIVVKDGFMMK